jgi:hypothetical protein
MKHLDPMHATFPYAIAAFLGVAFTAAYLWYIYRTRSKIRRLEERLQPYVRQRGYRLERATGWKWGLLPMSTPPLIRATFTADPSTPTATDSPAGRAGDPPTLTATDPAAPHSSDNVTVTTVTVDLRQAIRFDKKSIVAVGEPSWMPENSSLGISSRKFTAPRAPLDTSDRPVPADTDPSWQALKKDFEMADNIPVPDDQIWTADLRTALNAARPYRAAFSLQAYHDAINPRPQRSIRHAAWYRSKSCVCVAIMRHHVDPAAIDILIAAVAALCRPRAPHPPHPPTAPTAPTP